MASVKNISKRLHNTHGDFNHENIGEALELQIQKELQTNQIQLVDDWYLSRTEIDLCILAAINSKV